MKTKKVPMRKCLGCQTSKPKKELVRIVRTPEGEICVDVSGKLNGRGAYMCRSEECLKRAMKTKAIDRSLGVAVSAEIFEELKKELGE